VKNVKAILLSNTGKGVTADNFYEAQQEIHNPMVIFMDESNNELIKHYNIAADSMEQLTEMFKLKYFETTDLPEERYEKFAGAYFVGCGLLEGKTFINKKARTAATVQAS
jgi:hypothetical protein